MKVKYFLLIFVVSLFFIFIIITTINSSDIYSIKLEKGKNKVIFNLTNGIYVKTLFELNPNIEVVSYVENNKSVGYVKAFTYIGENFYIVGAKEYEIIVKDNTNLILPD
ncbi:hypothetical protein GOV12_04720 [Candidatus Pacearchaeota archaeon]|nr:hypothetical protein [Candidatus Pacearchaeota archaeon]